MIRQFLINIDLPYWANWYAMDSDGTVCLFRNKPKLGENLWLPRRPGEYTAEFFLELMNIDPAFIPNFNWRNTLHKIER